MLLHLNTAAAAPRAPRPRVRLAAERAEHAPAIERLLDDSFGPERWTKTCQLLRDGQAPLPGLSLVATFGDKVVGVVRMWAITVDNRRMLLLGPLAVESAWRNRGIGGRLVREALRRAAAAGERAVLLVGDAPYYERFGFRADYTRDLELPGPVDRARFLGRELVAGALDHVAGVVATRAA